MKELNLNTGAPRNVLAHVISSGIASALMSGTINYKKSLNNEISKSDALRDTIKKTSQGAIVAGTAISVTNQLSSKGGLLKALTTISIGMAGIYALEVLDETISKKNDEKLIEEGE